MEPAGFSLLEKVKNLLSFKAKTDEARFTDISQAVEAIAVSQKELLEKFTTASSDLAAANKKIDELNTAAENDRAAFSAFKELIEKTPDGTAARPAASGGSGAIKTDC